MPYDVWDQRLGFWWIAEDHPDLLAVADSPTGKTMTYAELAGEAHRLARALQVEGIDPGEIVAYALPNGIHPIVWQLACQESGLRYLALNPALSAEEFATILEHSGAAVLVIDPRFEDRVAGLTDMPGLRLRVTTAAGPAGFVPVSDLVAGHPAEPPARQLTGGPISYSSGTTGKPKGILRPLPTTSPGETTHAQSIFGRAFRFTPFEGTHLVSAGMSHGGCQSFYLGALNVGQALVIMERFDPERSLALIEQHAVSTAYMVPTQFVRLLRLPEVVRHRHDLSSLSTVVHSAAPCPMEVKQQMMEWWGPVIWETYGGMEGAATIAKPHHWLARPGTVGRAIKGVSIRILDDDGNEVPRGTVGHVFQEPAGPRFSYRDDPDLTREVFRGKAFTIGDMGYLDDDGFLFICDRAKDMIISGGVNIYPAEVEGTLSSHPSVADVAVIGVPDAEWGEQVKAIVQLVDPDRATDELAADLIAFARARLAGYKCPRSVEFRPSLPRTDTGKLMKRSLRDEYWAAAGRRV